MTPLLRPTAILIAIAALATSVLATPVLATSTATASEGSVPAEVRAYVEDGDLVTRLADVYGPDGSGNGIEFDETTETGEISRVHTWTEAQLAGEDTDAPIQLINEWIVPITIDGEPVGLATIWINPDRVEPELSQFQADPNLATALSAIPDTEALIRDDVSSAWLTLSDEGIVTPLVPGSTGLTVPVPLDEVALLPPTEAQPVSTDPHTGLALAIGVVVLLVIVIVVALLLPGWKRRRGES